MKKQTIFIYLIGAAVLTACGDAKLTAYEFKQAAKAECGDYKEVGVLVYQECFDTFYNERMEAEVMRNEMAQADNDRKLNLSDLKRNRR